MTARIRGSPIDGKHERLINGISVFFALVIPTLLFFIGTLYFVRSSVSVSDLGLVAVLALSVSFFFMPLLIYNEMSYGTDTRLLKVFLPTLFAVQLSSSLWSKNGLGFVKVILLILAISLIITFIIKIIFWLLSRTAVMTSGPLRATLTNFLKLRPFKLPLYIT